MDKKTIDLITGEIQEMRLKEIIKKFWNINIIKTKQNNELDFKSLDNDLYFEIKGRNNYYNTYNTTMIGYNKIKYIKELNLKCIFIFAFIDGDYYYEYNYNDNFEIKIGGRKDRGKKEYKKYYYIPIEKLIKLNV